MSKMISMCAKGLIASAALFGSVGYAADPLPADTGAAASPFGTANSAVDTAELGKIAGRADVGQFIQAENNSTVSRNSVSGNSVTGGIAFDAQAFQNMNGLSVLSANTGNNVSINSSLNVNVALHP